MRRSLPEVRAARSLQRWLRRAALAAIPITGLTACGDNCERTPTTRSGYLAADAGWAPGSVHTGSECTRSCPYGLVCWSYEWDRCTVSAGADGGTLTCVGTEIFCGTHPCGRMPAGVRRAVVRDSPLAAELAAAAHLEGAAVFAFEALERELIAHGAPADLIERARSAQEDEERHHESASRLARRYGARVPAVEVDQVPVRTLPEIAGENAVEGCVRETYGAAVAAFQGERAGDPAVSRLMRSIAADEAEHASLGWAVDAWARSRLSRAQRALLDDQMGSALAELRRQVAGPVDSRVAFLLGKPAGAAAGALLAAIEPIWAVQS